ncbi:low-density lipoprotein receptor class A domain-containing protein 3-like [Asterias rubens]|uniref:low-density lipoprotein receptor class A domain-containing protein 3-like n=1 Tax=Asterias rubens TaxID=7604 RepID=UPI0014555A53|nr:low-density lipoprotein receptor class A domain-containing protein 3-like [Asterias rubens]
MAAFGTDWPLNVAYGLSFFVLFLPSDAAVPCSSNPCSNGGTCQAFMDHYVCLCDVFWRGKHCQLFKGFADSPPITAPCSVQEFRCYSGHCVPERFVCDGTKDCVDGSDEKDCSSVIPTLACAMWEFDCGKGACVPKERQCDRIRDCSNGEDEHNCENDITQPPATPLRPVETSPNLIDILIVSCAMLMTFMAITIFVYVRRVRRMQQRYFAAVGHPHHLHHHHHHHSGRRRRRSRSRRMGDVIDANGEIDTVTTPYRLTQHSNFCHHLPPHRCPARTNLLVSYNLNNGVQIPQPISTSDKDEDDVGDEVPPTYLEVVGAGFTAAGMVMMQGNETPPPAYEDLQVEDVL